MTDQSRIAERTPNEGVTSVSEVTVTTGSHQAFARPEQYTISITAMGEHRPDACDSAGRTHSYSYLSILDAEEFAALGVTLENGINEAERETLLEQKIDRVVIDGYCDVPYDEALNGVVPLSSAAQHIENAQITKR